MPLEENQCIENVAQITNSAVGSDGQDFWIYTIQPDRRELTLVIPQSQLNMLIYMAAAGFTENNKTQGIAPEAKFPFDTNMWDLTVDKDTKRDVLSLTLNGGGRLDFALATGMPEQMLQRFQTIHSSNAAPKPSPRPR